MAVALLFDRVPYTVEECEAIRAQVAAATLTPPKGAIFHLAGEGPDGWRVIEVWETLDDAERFDRLHLAPVLAELGLPERPEPEVWHVHRMSVVPAPPS